MDWRNSLKCLSSLVLFSISFTLPLTLTRTHIHTHARTHTHAHTHTHTHLQIPLPMINGKVVQILLTYLYTGRCLFPRDDLNLGIELMAAADQFLLEPMKAQCEQILSQKIDQEVCVCVCVCGCVWVGVTLCGASFDLEHLRIFEYVCLSVSTCNLQTWSVCL